MTTERNNQNVVRIFQQWEAGNVQAQEALEALALNLVVINDSVKAFEKSQQDIKDYAGRILTHIGEESFSCAAGGFNFSKPSVRYSWDSDKLLKLIADLIATTEPVNPQEIAQVIAQARKDSPVAGSMRFTMAKGSK